jgi:glycosyltransferase involved in cell wall biosynthesis
VNKIKVIYDLEVIGNSYKNNQTGVYRVAYEIFRRLTSRKNLKVFYSNFNFNNDKQMNSKVQAFISENKIVTEPANSCERVRFLPLRKEKFFRKIYNKLGISDYKISYNKEMDTANIYHSLYYPIHKSLAKYPDMKKIVTIHDLIPVLFPQYNSNTELLENTVRSIGKDNFAICVSENTKKDLINYAPYLNPEKIFVSFLAASPELFYKCDDKEKFAQIQTKYHIPDRYFLSVSTLEPRKNIDHVIRCFIKTIIENKIDDLCLVLVGDKGWDFDKIFNEYDDAKDFQNRIIITGRIPDEDLASIYSHANSFYYMSFYEGFGLPPLEAMQCGTPSVVSNVSSLPEVVGDAGVLLNPEDEEGLVTHMWKLYSDEIYRKELSQKSIEQAKKFSWEKTVQQHVEIYQQICSA